LEGKHDTNQQRQLLLDILMAGSSIYYLFRHRNPRPLGVVKNDRLCRNRMPWGTGIMKCWPALARFDVICFFWRNSLDVVKKWTQYEFGLGQVKLGLAE
jgi:hypothetical protein